MKFAKELDEQAIPEWKANYFDYKQGKKKLKAIGRAIRNVPASPQTSAGQETAGASLRDAPVFSLLRRRQTLSGQSDRPQREGPDRPGFPRSHSHLATGADFTPSISEAEGRATEREADSHSRNAASERSPLTHKTINDHDLPLAQQRMRSYGSIIGSPPKDSEDTYEASRLRHAASSLRLPNPAIPLNDDDEYDRSDDPWAESNTSTHHAPATQMAHQGSAYEIRKPVDVPLGMGDVVQRVQSQSARPASVHSDRRPLAKRLFSAAGTFASKSRPTPLPPLSNDIALEGYRELDFRKGEFFNFLDEELKKINVFYTAKEDEAVKQLGLLREQLHILRERRLAEIESLKRHEHPIASRKQSTSPTRRDSQHVEAATRGRFASSVSFAHETFDRVRAGHVGKTSTAMGQLGTPTWLSIPDYRDYASRPMDISHHTAKRKMKMAMVEYYRSVEMIKSYAAINRTAFRKIIKKYDKTARSRTKGQYMDENVNSAHFVDSDTVDNLLSDTESLYARYFERGNHKIAVTKLRAKVAKAGDYVGSIGRSCFLLGVGTFMGGYGLVNGAELLFSSDATKHQDTSFLLQLYAGYFLMVLLSGLFALDAAMFSRYKINYPDIFELELKSHLDWKQLAEIPALFFFLMCGAMWLNFSIHLGGDTMFHYWFVVLIAVSSVWFFFPAKVLYHKTRLWFLRSLFRLFFSGFYTIEFRDFFLGDMFCSLTYPLGNIELFFCLYARDWTNDVAQCTSSHSRLLGFFSAVPGIWRAIQCVRRYVNTGSAFPHMVNFGKYCCTILQYVSLSVYRIDRTPESRVFFIVCASVNTIYCIIWDLNYDWSLLDLRAKKHKGLRTVLAYAHHGPVWIYYFALIVDPILRCNWIPYAVYTEDIQHATIVSFLVALSEVLRRAMWTLFRVENEHVGRVIQQKTGRSYDLPYLLKSKDSLEAAAASSRAQSDGTMEQLVPDRPEDTPTKDPESGRVDVNLESPIARALNRVGTTLRTGYQQDYVRKSKSSDTPPEDSDEDTDGDSE